MSLRVVRALTVPSLLLGFSLLLGGCETFKKMTGQQNEGRPDSPRISLIEQWNQTILDFGHFPVVPMREDLRVGDVFAIADEPLYESRTGALGLRMARTTRWGAIDVNPLLDKEYRQRSAFPTTPEVNRRTSLELSALTANGGAAVGPVYTADNAPIRQRLVSLRGLSATLLTPDELEPFLPPELAPLITGPISTANLAVTVRVGSAESYSISQDVLLDQLLVAQEGASETEYYLRHPHRLGLVARPGTYKMYLAVVTELILVRSVDVTLRSKVPLPGYQTREEGQHPFLPASKIPPPPPEEDEESSAEGDVAEAEAEAEAEEEKTEAEEEMTEAEIAAAAAPPPESRKLPARFRDAFDRANELNKLFEDIDVDAPLNGSISFVSATERSITIRRSWPRGLAISGRGMTLEVNPNNGQVLQVGPLGVAFRERAQ